MKCFYMKIFLSLLLTMFSINIEALTIKNNQILDDTGTPIQMKGINWFGFNSGTTMVDGLWSSDSLSGDFSTVVYRMQLLGFNAVRLPFSFKDLYNLPPANFTHSNCPSDTTSAIQTSVTNPNVPVAVGSVIPPQIAPPLRTPGLCNDYLPNDTTLNRFLWVINFFAKNGFYVLIDNHREDPTVVQDTTQWIQDWVRLITAIAADPISKDKVMVDILNEPDFFGIRWEASGSNPALKDLYLNAMDAINAVNPSVLYFIEGTAQGGIGANWGDGFCTNPNTISAYGLSDPNPFFQALLLKSYVNRVVISPHVYPPSVTNATTNYSGKGLWNRLANSFGYLTQKGYCPGTGTCKVFPVVIGEFGSEFATSTDITSMTDIASYLNYTGGAADQLHRPITSWFYWDWNADSGDTGGIVGNDWSTIIWEKIDYLTTLGLKPWYLNPAVPEVGTMCVSVQPTTGLTKNLLQPVTANGYTFNVTDFNTPICQSLPVGEYVISAPPLLNSTTQFNAPSQTINVTENSNTSVKITYTATPLPRTGNFNVQVQLGASWQTGDTFSNTLNFYVQNRGPTAVNVPWTIQINNSSYLGVESSWNVALGTVQNGTINASAVESWEDLTAQSGNSINFGMNISSSVSDFTPTSIFINGSPAAVTIIK